MAFGNRMKLGKVGSKRVSRTRRNFGQRMHSRPMPFKSIFAPGRRKVSLWASANETTSFSSRCSIPTKRRFVRRLCSPVRRLAVKRRRSQQSSRGARSRFNSDFHGGIKKCFVFRVFHRRGLWVYRNPAILKRIHPPHRVKQSQNLIILTTCGQVCSHIRT